MTPDQQAFYSITWMAVLILGILAVACEERKPRPAPEKEPEDPFRW